MKFTVQFVSDYPPEKVFSWFAQPEHIVQLIVIDPKKMNKDNDSVPSHVGERNKSWSQWMDYSETEIDIQNLTTVALLLPNGGLSQS